MTRNVLDYRNNAPVKQSVAPCPTQQRRELGSIADCPVANDLMCPWLRHIKDWRAVNGDTQHREIFG